MNTIVNSAGYTSESLEKLASWWQERRRVDYGFMANAMARHDLRDARYWQAEQRIDHERAWVFLNMVL
jgi:hypothetical protein